MSELVKRVARAIATAQGYDPDQILVAYEQKRDTGSGIMLPLSQFAWAKCEKESRAAIEAMREAPKSVLWAGALHAVTEKDLEIWRAMIDEALRE